jgi:hypothetical protein
MRETFPIVLVCWLGALRAALGAEPAPQLWQLARDQAGIHRFSTLIPAAEVRDYLSTDQGIDAAIDFCKRTAITKIYLEEFRDGYQAKRETIERARDRFRAAGIEVSGCVTTTDVGKRSTNYKPVACYTDQPTQEHLQAIFEYAASLFDEIMIDDFLFTDCTCAECQKARQSRQANVAGKEYPVSGDTWEDYRCELMVQVCRHRILGPARHVNANVKIIIKYPQWYDRFHERGYEVLRETTDFDRIWVGTETRNYDDRRWGGTPQYEGYFIMRWLGGIGGEKCGGGWYDPYGTTEYTYLEQARQTVLGGARESMLFCYGSLLRDTGPRNLAALRVEIPELLRVAGRVATRKVAGVAAYKPANSHGDKEQRIFDFVGMLGLPLAPCHDFPADSPAAFFSVHALKDAQFPAKLKNYIASGKPVLLTDGLAAQLSGQMDLSAGNVQVLAVKGDPKSLLALDQVSLDALRAPLLKPIGHGFKAPARVALYAFTDGSWVIENFNDRAISAELDGITQDVSPRSWVQHWR